MHSALFRREVNGLKLYGWALVTSVLVVTCEAIFSRTDEYWRGAWFFVPVALAVNYAVYQLVRSAPSLPSAFVVFSTLNLGMRVAVALWLGQTIGRGTWAAVGLLALAAVVRHRWA